MWITKDVILLPTNYNIPGSLWINGMNELKQSIPDKFCPGPQYYQELYIVSDEEAKEGDFVYNAVLNDMGELIYSVSKKRTGLQFMSNSTEKKVIATTDKLQILNGYLDDDGSKFYLPRLPKEFIEYYICEYNKGNIITKVKVEYNTNNIHKQKLMFHPDHKKYFFEDIIHGQFKTIYLDEKLNVKSNNTITIKNTKDSWNREDLPIEDLKLIVNTLKNDMLRSRYLGRFEKQSLANLDKWIEQNL